MAVTNLNSNADITGFDAGLDSVTIVNYIEGIPGGRSLDVAGFTPKAIRAGHVVIKDTATGDYKPMPVSAAKSIAALGTITGGATGATDGNYMGVALLGGSGSGAFANVGVTGNAVTDIAVADGGHGYEAGDVLTASAGGVTFSVNVSAIVENPAYKSLPADHTIKGVVVASVTTDEAMVGIMVRGSVNEVASPYPVTDEIKQALPLIRFTQD
jgi:hypothetical protein